MSDVDNEELFERAAAALREPSSSDEQGREALVRAIRAHARHPRTAPRGAMSAWWMAIAAAAVAFAVGLGTGRAMSRQAAAVTNSVSDSARRHDQFRHGPPAARHRSLDGEIRGGEETATALFSSTTAIGRWSAALARAVSSSEKRSWRRLRLVAAVRH
jgi:hypothetical protein